MRCREASAKPTAAGIHLGQNARSRAMQSESALCITHGTSICSLRAAIMCCKSFRRNKHWRKSMWVTAHSGREMLRALRSQPIDCLLVECRIEVFLQRREECFIVIRDAHEERHGRMEFQTIRMAENILDRSPLGFGHEPRTFAQSRPKHRVTQICLRLAERRDGVLARRSALPETVDLRKDVPHPVAVLAARAELRNRLRVNAALRVHEAP